MKPEPEKRWTVEQEELRGFARTVAEIEWLLLILALVYLVFGGPDPEDRPAVAAALLFDGAFVLGFHYANLYRPPTRWKIALETWVMIAFITWVIWFTGRLASPLVNAYMLVIVTSALTLGRLATLAEMGLIGACFLLLGEWSPGNGLPSLAWFGTVLAQLAPLILVAYVTTMFAADIRYGMNRGRLASETDELTGLYNMRGFAIAVDQIFAHSVRNKRPASVLIIDTDNLRTVNELYGEEARNRLLKFVAKCAEAELRHTDVLARYGSDEFVALLPETPASGALDVAERIRRAAAAVPVEVDGKQVTTSVSIGISSYDQDGGTVDSMLERADRAMALAKEQGRNQVVKFTL